MQQSRLTRFRALDIRAAREAARPPVGDAIGQTSSRGVGWRAVGLDRRRNRERTLRNSKFREPLAELPEWPQRSTRNTNVFCVVPTAAQALASWRENLKRMNLR